MHVRLCLSPQNYTDKRPFNILAHFANAFTHLLLSYFDHCCFSLILGHILCFSIFCTLIQLCVRNSIFVCLFCCEPPAPSSFCVNLSINVFIILFIFKPSSGNYKFTSNVKSSFCHF